MQKYMRNPNESYTDYFVRLFEKKDQYGLTCDDIAKLLNAENGNDYSECTYRKEYAAFNRGRIFERSLHPSNIHKRILSISDLHVPFQKPAGAFAKYAGQVDILQINGDVTDCASISKFSKAYRNSVMEEIIEARQYLIELIELLHPREVILTYGNHDARFENYLARNLDTDILELMPRTSLELIVNDGFHHYDKRNRAKVWYSPLSEVFEDTVITYADNWYCTIGKTIFCHPLAYSSGMMKTAEKAMYFFRNEGLQFNSLVMAHTHRIGSYLIGNTTIFEQGACCETAKMKYNDGKLVNSQKEGCLYIEQDKDGNIIHYHQEILNQED